MFQWFTAMAQGAGDIKQAEAQQHAIMNKAETDRANALFNAAFIEFQAEDALRRGDKQAERIGERGRQVAGAQRVAAAAAGVDIDSGTASELQTETFRMSALDQLEMRNNAWRESFGLRSQAQNQRAQSRLAYWGAEQTADAVITGAYIKAGGRVLSSLTGGGGEGGGGTFMS